MAAAQATSPSNQSTPQTPSVPRSQILYPDQTNAPKPPDMVCFGYGPKWSIQFVNGAARYLGVNQPDQTLLGDFYWVAQDKAWEWHRANGLAPMNGNFDLSATIQKQACTDPVRKQTYPYAAQVNLPQGDMVSGCCRKLMPGEAVVGKHGLQQTAPGSYGSSSGTQGGAQTGSQQSGQDSSQQSAPAPSGKSSKAPR
jgi:uncharacterized membrane protein